MIEAAVLPFRLADHAAMAWLAIEIIRRQIGVKSTVKSAIAELAKEGQPTKAVMQQYLSTSLMRKILEKLRRRRVSRYSRKRKIAPANDLLKLTPSNTDQRLTPVKPLMINCHKIRRLGGDDDLIRQALNDPSDKDLLAWTLRTDPQNSNLDTGAVPSAKNRQRGSQKICARAQ